MAQSKATSVDMWLDELATPDRPAFERLRALCRQTLPGWDERMQWGMPGYGPPGRDNAVSFNAQKRHIAFYAGWPKAWAAFNLAKEVWSEDVKGDDAKAAFQREMIFPIGEPNTAYAKYFKGNSYLAQISDSQIPFFNVTFEPGCRNNVTTRRTNGTTRRNRLPRHLRRQRR